MSTYIGGYRAELGMVRVHRLLIGMRDAIAEIGGRKIDSEIAKATADRFDRISAGRIERPETPMVARDIASDVFREIDQRFLDIAKSGYRDPNVDTSFDVWLFPDGECTLLIPNCEQREMLDLLKTDLALEDHHWQNSTDRPEDVSAADWNRRREDWDRVMPSGVAANTCLTYRLFDGRPWMHTDRERMWKLIPSRDERIRRLAEDIHITDNWDKDLGMSQAFDLMESYRNDEKARKTSEDAIRKAIIDIGPESPVQFRLA